MNRGPFYHQPGEDTSHACQEQPAGEAGLPSLHETGGWLRGNHRFSSRVGNITGRRTGHLKPGNQTPDIRPKLICPICCSERLFATDLFYCGGAASLCPLRLHAWIRDSQARWRCRFCPWLVSCCESYLVESLSARRSCSPMMRCTARARRPGDRSLKLRSSDTISR